MDSRLEPLKARLTPEWERWGMSCPDGWVDLVVTLDQKLAEIDPDYKLHQVKEKFGTLRFYCEHEHTDKCGEIPPPENTIKEHSMGYTVTIGEVACAFWAAVRAAEAQSAHFCDKCGQPGEMKVTQGWARTLCVPHREEHEARMR